MQRRTLLTAFALAPWCTVPRIGAAQHAGHTTHVKRAGIALSAAVAPDGSLWVVALNEERKLFVQRTGGDGRHWSNPRVLDTGQDAIAAEGENRPKLRFGPQGWAVISYTQPLSKPYSGEIRMLRSTDGGQSFSPPFTVHRDRQVITHRFESVAFDATGALHTLWIDKRDLEAARRKNEAPYAGAAVYRNVSTDGGQTFGPDIKVADHSCECCRIALVNDANGGLAAMWRHVFDGNVRDHAFTRIAPGGAQSAPIVRATVDDWRIDACPHHGPALTAARGGGHHAVWYGIRNGEPAVRYVRLDSSGKPGSPVRPIPDPGAEHADVCAAGSHLAIVWRSFDGERTRYNAWLSRDDGRSFEQRSLGASDVEADYPVLVRRADDVVALWRTRSEIRAMPLFGERHV